MDSPNEPTDQPNPNRLDRGLQQQILTELATAYPASISRIQAKFPGTNEDVLIANLWYLDEHGLVDSGIKHLMNGYAMTQSRITARGMDFLTGDGGLSAILGTVTVRLHADTLRELLVARVEASELPPAEKKSITDHLRQLPEVTLKEATTTLVKAGLDRLPDAVEWLRRLGGF